MSSSNGKGVIRITRKGRRSFAFGEEGTPGSEPFEVDILTVFQEWLNRVDDFRQEEEDEEGNHPIPQENVSAYHQAAVDFVEALRGGDKSHPEYVPVSKIEALEFVAQVREAYDDLVGFTQARSREERASPATSEGGSVELRFSPEPAPAQEN